MGSKRALILSNSGAVLWGAQQRCLLPALMGGELVQSPQMVHEALLELADGSSNIFEETVAWQDADDSRSAL